MTGLQDVSVSMFPHLTMPMVLALDAGPALANQCCRVRRWERTQSRKWLGVVMKVFPSLASVNLYYSKDKESLYVIWTYPGVLFSPYIDTQCTGMVHGPHHKG